MTDQRSSKDAMQQLEKSASLHWFHWLIIVLSLLLTLFAWQFSQQQVDEKIKNQFDRESQQVVELVLERIQLYGEALWAGVATLQMDGYQYDYKTWNSYVSNLNLLKKYPGINGIGVIHQVKPEKLNAFLAKQRKLRPSYQIYPPHKKKYYLPITYITPLKGNEKAVGLDMAHEKNRHEAALKAKDTGNAQITGPIVLVQDQEKTPGFLFYAPFYRNGPYPSKQLRDKHFIGLVYAPFIVKKLMNGVLSKKNRHISIKISDGSDVLYNELLKSNSKFDPNPSFTTSEKISVYGRTWIFTLASDKAFVAATANNQPLTILFSGLFIDILLLLLFVTITKSRQRALVYADGVTEELQRKAAVLKKSNQELNKFAYITSHDLRAPLRAIDNLAQWIIEDDAENLSDESKKRLQMLQSRIKRMNGLINGILAYSRAGNLQTDIDEIDLNVLLLEIIDGIGNPDNVTLRIPEPLPTIKTNMTVIGQVFSNLITNAIKHSDKEKIEIELSYKKTMNGYQFSVSDNGPGIAEEYHEKIFDLFQTLKPKDEVDSSGVGLALIKKSVEAADGSVYVSSSPDQGCVFTFSWSTTHHKET